VPLDPAALRVLADELLERGDVHGEFILLQCEREARGSAQTSREKELHALLEKNLQETLATGPLALSSFSWRSGLLSSVLLEDSETLASQLQTLAQWPLAQHLEELGVVAGGGQSSFRHFRAPLTPAPFPALRKFSVQIGQSWLGRPRVDFELSVGDVQPLYARWPRLEVLELHGNDHALGEIRLPQLRRFAASYLQPNAIPSLVNAWWPKLEELDLVFAHTPAEADPVFGALLEAPMSPVLQTVRIRSPWPEFFRAALPRSRLGRGRTVQVE
jgi:hypothetical protein